MRVSWSNNDCSEFGLKNKWPKYLRNSSVLWGTAGHRLLNILCDKQRSNYEHFCQLMKLFGSNYNIMIIPNHSPQHIILRRRNFSSGLGSRKFMLDANYKSYHSLFKFKKKSHVFSSIICSLLILYLGIIKLLFKRP